MNALSEHLFRHEWGRMVAALTRIFGVNNLALAEDVAQEAFCRAVETWAFRGAPENPQAWLMMTAKNCALDVLRRERTARSYAPQLERHLQSEWSMAPTLTELMGRDAIKDDLLRMMFSCCHPRLPDESQLALILNILCGLSVEEVAAALMVGHSAAEKRITRAKKSLAATTNLFDLDSQAEFAKRLPTVQRALYLLFNEGYHGASRQSAIRAELCREAMRLMAVLLEHRLGATAESYALSALMCLNGARLPGRVDALGDLQPLSEQDRNSWSGQLIAEGLELLKRSAVGASAGEYHIEAAIAGCHAIAQSNDATDWTTIASLYDALMEIRPSPVVALNRAIAIAQVEGAERGLVEIAAIVGRERLDDYPFYYAALGELEFRRDQRQDAHRQFLMAASKARSPMERSFLERRARRCLS